MDDNLNLRVRYDLYDSARHALFPEYLGKRLGILGDLKEILRSGRFFKNVSVEADDGIFDPISVEETMEILFKLLFKHFKSKKLLGRFRDGPWPGTGKFRRHSHWMRYPKTTGEIAANENDLILMKEVAEEYGKTFGEGRLRRKIPHAWSDTGRHIEKNWKRQRKTQWR
jgi:hypothetical protein